MTSKKTLFLTIKKEYFDQIKRGAKKSEFREYKPFWIKKLMNADGSFQSYDFVLFRNGYHPDAPKLLVKFNGTRVKKERQGWFRSVKYFEIKLGEIIDD